MSIEQFQDINFIFLDIVSNAVIASCVLLICFTILIFINECIEFIISRIKFYIWKKKQKPYEERMLNIRRKRLSSKEINDLYKKSRKEL